MRSPGGSLGYVPKAEVRGRHKALAGSVSLGSVQVAEVHRVSYSAASGSSGMCDLGLCSDPLKSSTAGCRGSGTAL